MTNQPKPAASPGTRRALVHNAITSALSEAGDWVPLSVRIAATRAALAEVDAWHAAEPAAVAPPTTHGLSIPHADALWDAVAPPGPGTTTYPEQHERVCRAVRQILDELLPAPADRAAVLREADWIVEHCPDHGCVEPSTEVCHCEIADRLRRMADETPDTAPPVCSVYQPPKAREDSGYCARCGMYDWRHTSQAAAALGVDPVDPVDQYRRITIELEHWQTVIVPELTQQRHQLAVALADVLQAFHPLSSHNGERLGWTAPHPIHPDDYDRWNAALKEQPEPAAGARQDGAET